ncbi:tannase and feruloyl esterase [Aaosphaeria arxii CBS 175.79]|uniref:Carboxylic ester hydrolase n=1 Tax=Aaosphaeria arxii CBS 175.79 TaxID=1450172 RepID=A0A6A5XXZ2_9PLEO|nr:tannase and feruloyl esterase [Aaosphaeria arxii CBS 175.79]KAF2017819.1 tannase and feruloyl esterase [Aaosphaeria arxii CBS 175.79]
MKLAVATFSALFGIACANENPYSSPNDFQAACSSIIPKLNIEHATVQFAEYVPAGTNLSISDRNVTCGSPWQVVAVDICRIGVHVATSTCSGIVSEAWLPANWTGRFLGTGNGGLNGCINYPDLAYGVELGFATVGANNGHNGTSGGAFFNSPEVLEDFVYRSVHTNVITGKEITRIFYGEPHTKSYYLGCSTGGRQGFKEAQDFPEDFDGIVAGAPAFDWNDLMSWTGRFYTITGDNTSDTFVPQTLWPLIHEDVLKQCDGLDGVEDGILENPKLCNYDSTGLICSAGETENCLTPTQSNTVQQLLSPLTSEDGSVLYPRLQPGSEIGAAARQFTGEPGPYPYDWYRWAIYNDSTWDPASLNYSDYDFANSVNPFNIATWKGDLSDAKDRGVKILHYHGLEDPAITSEISPVYYEHVSSTMGLPPSELDAFYRFFQLSGTAHCTGGAGASVVGQRYPAVGSFDPKENVLMAVVDWVENGNAPEYITGTKWVNGTKSSGVDYKRRHCKYPKTNHFKGGDAKNPDSWECE